MKFSVPTNWQEDLLPIFKSSDIYEVYGKFAQDYIGGGRPTYSLSDISKKYFIRYIKKIHEYGCKFNYLINASCLGGIEFTQKGKKEILKLLEYIFKNNVDTVTISLPYLAEIIKKNFPSLKINVSTMAHVDTLEKAKFWESIGVDCITLSHTKLNRDFKLLKLIRKNVKCNLQLIANNHCLYNCPFQDYHEAFSSHASQAYSHNGFFIFDYCNLTCRFMKIFNPSLLISAPWIRPEDVSLYEQIGIDSIKLVDRRLPTQHLIKIIKAYLERKYEGNLIDLFPGLLGYSPLNLHNFFLRTKYLLSQSLSIDIFKIIKIRKLLRRLKIYVDNKLLDRFIDFFLEHDCKFVSCQECDYCRKVAEKVVKIDPGYRDKICKEYKNFLSNFI